jgi:hypothetical protein
MAACPFSYFLQYGLKAKPRQPAEFAPPEMGTFMHYVLENVARDISELGGFAAVPTETVNALCWFEGDALRRCELTEDGKTLLTLDFSEFTLTEEDAADASP